MGGGVWDVGSYSDRANMKATSGTPTFDYDAALRRNVPYGSWAVHAELDPSKLNSFGARIREARDSAEHPCATPIAVLFDVTASMNDVPRILQQKLPQLHGVLQRRGYVADPQILFGGVGDAYSDRVPLQLGEFESDNRMDEQLEKMVLEGGGGGGNHESYELAAYFMAYHTDLDCWKRNKKGYLFFIGDERVYSRVDRSQVETIIGDQLPADLTTEEVFQELRLKYEVFYLFATQGTYQPEDVLVDGGYGSYHYGNSGVCYWRDLLGQNALILDDASAVCETIALTLAMYERGVSQQVGVYDLIAAGADRTAAEAAGKALAPLSGGSSAVTSTSKLPEEWDDGTGATRL